MATCPCNDLDTVVKVENHPFIKGLRELEAGNWIRLMECNCCGQLWAVAEWDKYQTQLATKIPISKRASWQKSNVEAEKDFLIKSRGGLTAEPCAWARCGKPHVVGVAFCVDHLYETGARE